MKRRDGRAAGIGYTLAGSAVGDPCSGCEFAVSGAAVDGAMAGEGAVASGAAVAPVDARSIGSRTTNVAPPPGVASCQIRPSCAWTRAAAIDSPRPVPPLSRERPGSAR